MSVLVANSSYDFSSLKELLQVTDGNLASHLKGLEKEGYVSVKKTSAGRSSHSDYKATAKGREAFMQHLEALSLLIRRQKK